MNISKGILFSLVLCGLFIFGCTASGSTNSTGHAVFAIKDAAANMGAVSSVQMTVDRVDVHSTSEGWVTASSATHTYDLMQLKSTGQARLLADANLKSGTYDQMRLHSTSVVVVDDKGSHDAKLPSNDFKMMGTLIVKENSTSSATFDFIADESLHTTGKGEYIMAPVIQEETRSDAQVDASNNDDVRINGGTVNSNAKVGMDIHGNMGVGLGIANDANLDITGGVIVVGNAGGSGSTQGSATGNAAFIMKDAAANMETVTSVQMTVDKVEVHSSTGAWVTASSATKTYDLVKLRNTETAALMADAKLAEGTYDQIRLHATAVTVVDANGTHQAKLPSNEFKMDGQIVVTANHTSTATFDFIADESLHVTGKGQYIMAPVIQEETRSNAEVDESSETDVHVNGGNVLTNTKIGMDEKGNMGVGLGIAADADLDVDANGMVKVLGHGGLGVGVN